MITTLLSRHKWLILVAVVLSVVSALAGIAVVSLITDEIKQLSTAGEELTYTLGRFLTAVVVVVFFGIASQHILSRLSATVVLDLRNTMVRRVLGTPYEEIERIGGHRVYATLTDDITNIAAGMTLLPHIVYSGTTVILCLGYMLYTSWQLFLFVMGLLTVVVLVGQLLMSMAMKHQEILRNFNDDLFSAFRALVAGGKELNLSSRRKNFFFHNVLSPVIDSIGRKAVRTELIYVILSNWTRALIFCVMGVIVYGAKYVFVDLSVEVVVAFILVVLYMVEPLETLVGMLNELGKSIVAHKKICSLKLSEETTFINTAGQSVRIFDEWDYLSVKGLSYQYQAVEGEDYCFSIGPIDLSFRRGETIFLTGGNGSGKSTFARVLTGLYTPHSGHILLDGKPVNLSTHGEKYRELYSTIFSDFYLFREVLNREGVPADDAIIISHLKDLQLDQKVNSRDGVLSAIDLSQGQRKRLALVSSYLEDTQICIYDEWAADQDPYFRNMFYTKLLPELKAKGKTLIVITHDDAYYKYCDRFIKFDAGKVVLNQVNGRGCTLALLD